MRIPAYVESGVAMAAQDTVVAWCFDLPRWGRCGQGHDEPSALAALAAELGPPGESVGFTVVERIAGDEQAFARDRRPATAAERDATLRILTGARAATLALLASCPPAVLDWADPDRRLPAFARWRTLRQMAWHLADTESRYYLPSLGLPARPRLDGLTAELDASAAHVRAVLAALPADLERSDRGEVWTNTKLLRRLAWHERSELVTMRELARRAPRPG